jgi:hypothetical protein
MVGQYQVAAAVSDETDARIREIVATHALEHDETITRAELVRRAIRLWDEIDNPQETLDG